MSNTSQGLIDKNLLNQAIILFEKIEGHKPTEAQAINYMLSLADFKVEEIEQMATQLKEVRQSFGKVARRSIRQGIEEEFKAIHRGAGAKIMERLKDIYEYNSKQTDINKKLEINTGLLREGLEHPEFYGEPELAKKVGSNPNTIREFITKYQEEIDAHHKEQGIQSGHNQRVGNQLRFNKLK